TGTLPGGDVETGIHVDRLTRNPGAEVGGEEDGRVGDLLRVHIAAEGGASSGDLQQVAEVGDPARGEGIQRARGHRVDANALLAEIDGKIADAGLEGGFGDPHHVVAGHRLLRSVI